MTALLSPPTLHRLLTYSPSDTDLDVTSVICFRPTITFPTFPGAKICVETYGSISPARKYVKYKTELCRNGLSCRYGKDCQYAHSPQELRKVKLSELVNAGLIDAETYRVKPCDIFVMTGSCPFGRRCMNLHDPRVAAPTNNPSTWQIPLKDKAVFKNIGDDDVEDSQLYIDQGHYDRMADLHNQTIFDHNYNIDPNDRDENSISSLFEKVCQDHKHLVLGDAVLLAHHAHVLEIALKMYPNTPSFAYKSTHLLQNEPCMMLQKRMFVLRNQAALVSEEEDLVIEVKDEMEAADVLFSLQHQANVCDDVAPDAGTVMIVYDIAFGTSSDRGIRRRALWLNIPEALFTPLSDYTSTKQQLLCTSPKRRKSDAWFFAHQVFDIYPTFGLDIVKEILHIRLRELKQNGGNVDHYRRQEVAKKILAMQQQRLQWSWPVCRGYEEVHFDSLEVDVKSSYIQRKTNGNYINYTGDIWDGFTDSMSLPFSNKSRFEPRNRRLQVFQDLTTKGNVDASTKTDDVFLKSIDFHLEEGDLSRNSIAWRSILLHDGPKDWHWIEREFSYPLETE